MSFDNNRTCLLEHFPAMSSDDVHPVFFSTCLPWTFMTITHVTCQVSSYRIYELPWPSPSLLAHLPPMSIKDLHQVYLPTPLPWVLLSTLAHFPSTTFTQFACPLPFHDLHPVDCPTSLILASPTLLAHFPSMSFHELHPVYLPTSLARMSFHEFHPVYLPTSLARASMSFTQFSCPLHSHELPRPSPSWLTHFSPMSFTQFTCSLPINELHPVYFPTPLPEFPWPCRVCLVPEGAILWHSSDTILSATQPRQLIKANISDSTWRHKISWKCLRCHFLPTPSFMFPTTTRRMGKCDNSHQGKENWRKPAQLNLFVPFL